MGILWENSNYLSLIFRKNTNRTVKPVLYFTGRDIIFVPERIKLKNQTLSEGESRLWTL